jgi:FCD domain
VAPNNSTTRWRRSLRSNCRLIDEVTRASLTEVLDQSRNRLNTTKHGIYEVPRGRAPGHADHLAAAAHMPRIETMFARLTHQLPLFVTLMGPTYRYAIDDTVDDAKRILAAIRTRDVDGAVSAWRRKVDNAARYMTAQPPRTSQAEITRVTPECQRPSLARGRDVSANLEVTRGGQTRRATSESPPGLRGLRWPVRHFVQPNDFRGPRRFAGPAAIGR